MAKIKEEDKKKKSSKTSKKPKTIVTVNTVKVISSIEEVIRGYFTAVVKGKEVQDFSTLVEKIRKTYVVSNHDFAQAKIKVAGKILREEYLNRVSNSPENVPSIRSFMDEIRERAGLPKRWCNNLLADYRTMYKCPTLKEEVARILKEKEEEAAVEPKVEESTSVLPAKASMPIDINANVNVLVEKKKTPSKKAKAKPATAKKAVAETSVSVFTERLFDLIKIGRTDQNISFDLKKDSKGIKIYIEIL